MSNETYYGLLILSLIYPVVLIISCYLGAKHGTRERLEEAMAVDYVRQFGGTLENAKWIVKNARPKK